jgi:hypothetical protein
VTLPIHLASWNTTGAALGRPWPDRGPATDDTGAWLDLAGLSFQEAVLEAAVRRAAEASNGITRTPAEVTPEPATSQAAQAVAPDRTTAEAFVIAREGNRTGVDPSLLIALRRTENGGPGKEFGVLSIPAPDLDSQARIAANTVRNTVTRFERGGGIAVDPTSGRYTEEFLRFLSSRYAPVGVQNDPTGLNRFHAANLIAHYQKASRTDG